MAASNRLARQKNPPQSGISPALKQTLKPERDQAELSLLARFTAAGRPVLGICRGIQTINVYFHGTLVQDLPGHEAVEGTDNLHRVYTEDSFLRRLYGASAVVNSAHRQVLDRLGKGLSAIQWTADGVVESVCHKTLPVWGVQWHPERCRMADGGRLFQAFLSLCGGECDWAPNSRI